MAGESADNTRLGAAGDCSRRGRFGKEAAVTALPGEVHRRLPLKSEDARVHERFS